MRENTNTCNTATIKALVKRNKTPGVSQQNTTRMRKEINFISEKTQKLNNKIS